MKNIMLMFLVFSNTLFSQSIESRVLVLKNTNSPVSIVVTDDYITRRNITKVLNISCQNSALFDYNETISYSNFTTQIKTPLLTYLNSHPEIDFIVLARDSCLNKVFAFRVESFIKK